MMQVRRAAREGEGQLEGVVPHPTETGTTTPALTSQQETERLGNLQRVLELELGAVQRPDAISSAFTDALTDLAYDPAIEGHMPKDFYLFTGGELPLMVINMSSDPATKSQQIRALEKLNTAIEQLTQERRETLGNPEANPPFSIDEIKDAQGNTVSVSVISNWYLPCSDETRAQIAGMLETARDGNLDSGQLAQFLYLYDRLKNALSSGAVLTAKSRIYGEDVGELLNRVVQKCNEAAQSILDAMRGVAEGSADSAALIDAADQKIAAVDTTHQDAFLRIADWFRSLRSFAFPEGLESTLSEGEASILKFYQQTFNSLSGKLDSMANWEYGMAAYVLDIPAGASFGGVDIPAISQQDMQIPIQLVSVAGVLELFKARARAEQIISLYELNKGQITEYYQGNSLFLAQRRGDLEEVVRNDLEEGRISEETADFILHWKEYAQELESLREPLVDYAEFLEDTLANQMPELRNVLGMVGRDIQAEVARRFAGIHEASERLRSLSVEMPDVFDYHLFDELISPIQDQYSSAATALDLVLEDASSIQFDQELFTESREGSGWDHIYAFSKYFMKYGANDFLFWSSIATLGVGLVADGWIAAGGAIGGAFGRQAVRSFITRSIIGAGETEMGLAVPEVAGAAAETSLARTSLDFGFRLASSINATAGIPVWANAMRYFGGNRSDEVYEDLGLMSYFLLTRGAAGGTSLIGRLATATSFGLATTASGMRIAEDVERGNWGQLVSDSVVYCIGGAMFVKSAAGFLSFADSAAAAGGDVTIGTAAGPATISLAQRAETQFFKWFVDPGLQPFTAPGFLGFYGFNMLLRTAPLLWQNIPELALVYEEDGFSGLRRYFSSTYAETASSMPLVNIIFHVPSNVAGLIRSAGGAAAAEAGGAGIAQISLQVPTTSALRTIEAEGAFGVSEVSLEMADRAGYLSGPEAAARETALREIALNETRLPEEQIISRLALEDTPAAHEFARSLNSELDSIWRNADLLASTRSLSAAQQRGMASMFTRAQELRGGSGLGTLGRGLAVGAAVAVPLAADRIASRLPEAEALVEKRNAITEHLESQGNSTACFLQMLSQNLYPGMYRKPFQLASLAPFHYTMAAMLSDMEDTVVSHDQGFDFTAIDGILPSQGSRTDMLLAVFLSLAAHGRLSKEQDGAISFFYDPRQDLSYYRNIMINVSSRLEELHGLGMDFSGMGLPEMFFLVDYILNRGGSDWEDLKGLTDFFLGPGAGITTTLPLLGIPMPSIVSPGQVSEEQRSLYSQQASRLLAIAFSYAIGKEKDADWVTDAVNRIITNVSPEQIAQLKAEEIYALLENPIFESRDAMDLMDRASIVQAITSMTSDQRLPVNIYHPELMEYLAPPSQ